MSYRRNGQTNTRWRYLETGCITWINVTLRQVNTYISWFNVLFCLQMCIPVCQPYVHMHVFVLVSRNRQTQESNVNFGRVRYAIKRLRRGWRLHVRARGLNRRVCVCVGVLGVVVEHAWPSRVPEVLADRGTRAKARASFQNQWCLGFTWFHLFFDPYVTRAKGRTEASMCMCGRVCLLLNKGNRELSEREQLKNFPEVLLEWRLNALPSNYMFNVHQKIRYMSVTEQLTNRSGKTRSFL